MTQPKLNRKIVGLICGIGAAVCYGTNPLGALNLYAEGMATGSVLFYRFGLAWLIIAAVVIARGESLAVSWRQFGVLSALGVLFSASSLTLYLSFHHIAAGVASTLLFTYPVMTAVIMALFFGERITLRTASSIALSLVGVVLLYWGGAEGRLSTLGVVLVLISALTYAVYIIVVGRSQLRMSPFKINFYVLIYCTLGALLYSLLSGTPITLPQTGRSWFFVGWLAVVPAIMALVMMVYSAKYLGSTPTAILGALEPLTAVMIGVLVFAEPFTLNLAIGIVLILSAVVIIALKKESPDAINNEKPR
ncbi:MAG: DMT family transporter [Bacteroidales bacterium]|nr:DMT family transporter [Bacteroidales bacterium]